jgi:hypothetical protein
MIRKSLTKNFIFVWDKDPALDKDHDDFESLWKQYEESGDVGVLPVLGGSQLAKFVCKPLSMNAYSRLASEPSEVAKCIEAVRYGLQAVSGYFIDGVEVKIEEGDKQKDGTDVRLKDAFLNRIWDPPLFGLMASAIHKASVLDPTRAAD